MDATCDRQLLRPTERRKTQLRVRIDLLFPAFSVVQRLSLLRTVLQNSFEEPVRSRTLPSSAITVHQDRLLQAYFPGG